MESAAHHKDPKLNGIVCTAYVTACRSIDVAERMNCRQLFAHVEELVDAGLTDADVVATHALSRFRGMTGPAVPKHRVAMFSRLAWLRLPGVRSAPMEPVKLTLRALR